MHSQSTANHMVIPIVFASVVCLGFLMIPITTSKVIYLHSVHLTGPSLFLDIWSVHLTGPSLFLDIWPVITSFTARDSCVTYPIWFVLNQRYEWPLDTMSPIVKKKSVPSPGIEQQPFKWITYPVLYITELSTLAQLVSVLSSQVTQIFKNW